MIRPLHRLGGVLLLLFLLPLLATCGGSAPPD
jgi:hypothetical protein